MRKAVTAAITLILVILGLCLFPASMGQEKTNVIIISDGVVTPSKAPIQQEGDVYTLTSGYEGEILILRSNIVFDGQKNIIQSPDNVEACLKLDRVSNVTIRNLVVRGALFGCMYGIKLDNASNCVITNNTIIDIWSIMAMNGIDYDGIHVNGGNSNVFTKNTLVNNLLGMNFIDTSNNVIVENTIDYTSQGVNSVPSGINFYRSSGNVIYHNTFKAEGTQTGSYESNNTWDNGFPNGGNYWSNYGAGGSNFTKINGTGIYDSPYLINKVNIDHYPLVEPYTAITPTITIFSVEGVYNLSSVPLSFTVDQPAIWMGYSLDGAQNVTLNENQTLTDLGDGQHTVRVYANDSFGNMGFAEFSFTVSVPVSPFLIVGVLTLAVVVSVIGGVIYYRYTKASTKRTKPNQLTFCSVTSR